MTRGHRRKRLGTHAFSWRKTKHVITHLYDKVRNDKTLKDLMWFDVILRLKADMSTQSSTDMQPSRCLFGINQPCSSGLMMRAKGSREEWRELLMAPKLLQMLPNRLFWRAGISETLPCIRSFSLIMSPSEPLFRYLSSFRSPSLPITKEIGSRRKECI